MVGRVILEATEVSCGYGKMHVVHDASLNLHEAETALIMGPNGSGKSTFVKAIVGLVDIFGGHILFDGKEIIRKSTVEVIRMGISYIPQTKNIFPALSVEENLEMGSALLERRLRSDSVNKIFEVFPEIRTKRNEPANRLSGGERQILAIARGLIGNPRILILDEPTAGLAPKIAKNVLAKIQEIRDTGVGILLVEQNARTALSIADTSYVIVAGSIVAHGPAQEIVKNEEVVQLFLGGGRQRQPESEPNQ